MIDWIDQKYINLLSIHTERFKQVENNVWNFRCPICGDSHKNKNKARGYIFLRDNHYIFKCHNCGHGASLKNFLKQIDTNLYNEYVTEKFIDDKKIIDTGEQSKKWQPQIENTPIHRHEKFEPLKSLKKVSQFPADHPVKKYVNRRMIPIDKHWLLYVAPKFNTWVNTIIPGKLDEKYDEPRLVIPFIDEDGYVFAVAGRSFKPDTDFRYITVKFDDSKPKIFGLNTVDWSKPIKVVEGPIDSLFLKNSLAFGGSDGDISFIENKEDVTIILDNQPRNREIVKKMEKYIDTGFKIVVWPDTIVGKDINDMIKSREISADEIDDFIDKHTYYDLVAKLKLAQWRKI